MRIVSAVKLSCIVLSVISLALLSGCSDKEQFSSTRAYRDEIVPYEMIDGPDTVIDPSGDIDREKELRKEVLNAFEILNDEREKQGLPPLMWNMALEMGAGYRAREIATAFDNDHTRPDGSKWFTAAPDDALGENIYCGSMTASEAMAAWLNNPPDRENFIYPGFTKCAIAIYEMMTEDFTGRQCLEKTVRRLRLRQKPMLIKRSWTMQDLSWDSQRA